MDEEGMKVFDATYDAWGKQTVSLKAIITIEYIGNNQVIIKMDTYNFEMHSWLKEPKRNIETLIARPVHGKGTPFDIYFRGVNTIHYNPHNHNAYRNYPSPYFCPLR